MWYNYCMKKCSTCKIDKDISHFPSNKAKKDGLNLKCRFCYNAYQKEWYTKNQEIHLNRVRKRRLEIGKLSMRLIAHNISLDFYTQLIEKYQDKCWICKEKKAVAIDHDHLCCPGSTSCGNCVRGVLCSQCNSMIGLGQDKPSILIAASEYLISYKR